jgi:hypothetical protein
MRTIIITALLLIGSVVWAVSPPQLMEIEHSIRLQSRQFAEENSTLNRVTTEYEVGDNQVFWRWNLSVMPPAWVQESATCRAVGEHCYVFVADTEWNVHMDQADVNDVMLYLEEQTMAGDDFGAIEMDEMLFGPVPDALDNDPKIIVYYTALGSFNGTSFDGYFSSYNQVTEQQAQQMNPSGHSNECEMIYMTCHPLNPVEPIRISVLSHELQHMIHWGGDINEELWVNEGCSELAMVRFGMPDPITVFPNQPDNSLIAWDQQWADYVKVQLFFAYLAEKYATPADSLIKDIVFEPQNSIAGIEAQLAANNIGKTFSEIFVDWTITNQLNDLSIMNGLYGYETLDVPAFIAHGNHNSFPAYGSGSVKAWAADYVRIYPDAWNYLIDVSASSPVTYALIYKNSDTDFPRVEIYNDGYFFATDAMNYDQVVLVIANDSDVAVDYSYEISSVVSVPHEPQVSVNRMNVYPNPCSLQDGGLLYSLPKTMPGGVATLYNAKGQVAARMKLHPETREQTMPLNQLGSGIYLLQVSNKSEHYSSKIIITQ